MSCELCVLCCLNKQEKRLYWNMGPTRQLFSKIKWIYGPDQTMFPLQPIDLWRRLDSRQKLITVTGSLCGWIDRHHPRRQTAAVRCGKGENHAREWDPLLRSRHVSTIWTPQGRAPKRSDRRCGLCESTGGEEKRILLSWTVEISHLVGSTCLGHFWSEETIPFSSQPSDLSRGPGHLLLLLVCYIAIQRHHLTFTFTRTN